MCVDNGMASGRTDDSLLFQKSLELVLKGVLYYYMLKCIFGCVTSAGGEPGHPDGIHQSWYNKTDEMLNICFFPIRGSNLVPK